MYPFEAICILLSVQKLIIKLILQLVDIWGHFR